MGPKATKTERTTFSLFILFVSNDLEWILGPLGGVSSDQYAVTTDPALVERFLNLQNFSELNFLNHD